MRPYATGASRPHGPRQSYPTPRPRIRRLLALLCLGALPLGLAAAEPAAAPAEAAADPAPYQRLREATMSYNGPSEDFTNLTEIRIGWFAPSDPADPLNGDYWWAADLAVRDANATRASAAPGSFEALPFRLVPCWAPDPWRAGVSLLARMVYDQQPLAIIGSIDSASTHLAEQVVAKANLPLVSPIATDKTATLAGVSWMFSCAPDDAAIARVLVDDVLANPKGSSVGAALRRDSRPSATDPSRDKPAPTIEPASPVGAASRRDSGASVGSSRREPPVRDEANHHSAIPNPQSFVVLLSTTDHESRMSAREVSRELSRHGITPALRLDLSPGVTNAEEALRSIDAQTTAVVVIADPADSARLVRAVRARFGDVAVFGSEAMGRQRFLELAGPAAEGVRFPLLFEPSPHDEISARFKTRFVAERHHAPDYSAALAYDATRLLIDAVHRAGPNRARIREVLAHAAWAGVAGPIRFDGTGQNPRTALRLGTVAQGAIVPIAGTPASGPNANSSSQP